MQLKHVTAAGDDLAAEGVKIVHSHSRPIYSFASALTRSKHDDGSGGIISPSRARECFEPTHPRDIASVRGRCGMCRVVVC